MKVHSINSAIPQGGRNATGPSSATKEEHDKQPQQIQTEASSANIKKDPTRLPEKAQLATAHVARTLLSAQAENFEAEHAKNFGQFVSKVARGEEVSEIDLSLEDQAIDIAEILEIKAPDEESKTD